MRKTASATTLVGLASLVLTVLMALTVLTALAAPARAATITYEGRDYWINGVNVPWNNFGVDAGEHDTMPVGYEPAWFEDFFSACQAHGVNCVRLWIHCDGRASPEFDGAGYVTGLDEAFLSDLEDICARADAHDLMVMPCLWSFDMTENYTALYGPHAGLHADLITDAAKTQSYIDNALVPMVQHLADTPNLFAWEITNEPEWSVSGTGGDTFETVTLSELQRFCAVIAEAIHLNSAKMVTVGSASLKWCSDVWPAEGNWWSDLALQTAYDSSLAYLDFYQVHYWDWMWEWGYDPFDPALPVSVWDLDKPVLVGECPANNLGEYTMQEQIDNAYANGYAGVMFWSYNAENAGNWPALADILLAFRDAHPEIVDYAGSGALLPDTTSPSSCVATSAGRSRGAPVPFARMVGLAAVALAAFALVLGRLRSRPRRGRLPPARRLSS